MLKRITIAKRMRAKLRESKEALKRRRPLPVPDQGHWLASVGCVGTSPTTPCPATSMRSQRSALRQLGTGIGRYGAAASAHA